MHGRFAHHRNELVQCLQHRPVLPHWTAEPFGHRRNMPNQTLPPPGVPQRSWREPFDLALVGRLQASLQRTSGETLHVVPPLHN
jgi:hypothetical protein